MTDQSDSQNPKKLFVGSLPFETTDTKLNEIFSQYGEIVDLKLIIDRYTGQSKGIAFIEYATQEQAAEAMASLNGSQIGERNIIVSIARPPQNRGGFGSDRPNYQQNRRRF